MRSRVCDSLSCQTLFFFPQQIVETPAWVIEGDDHVHRRLVFRSHLAVDDGGGGAVHCRDVVLHALCGVDQETESLAGPSGDPHRSARGME